MLKFVLTGTPVEEREREVQGGEGEERGSDEGSVKQRRDRSGEAGGGRVA
jgi:hypothetical protein